MIGSSPQKAWSSDRQRTLLPPEAEDAPPRGDVRRKACRIPGSGSGGDPDQGSGPSAPLRNPQRPAEARRAQTRRENVDGGSRQLGSKFWIFWRAGGHIRGSDAEKLLLRLAKRRRRP